MIHLCIPVLRRYDLLQACIRSALAGQVKPDHVWILDNGRHRQGGSSGYSTKFDDHEEHWFTPDHNLGVAASWNWFIRQTTGDRIIANDDVLFAPDSIGRMANAEGPFVTALAPTNAFSCFLIRDECVDKVGWFDEAISPGYAYFEDVDYAWRMEAAGVKMTEIDAGVKHMGSASLVPDDEHNRRFMIAQENFERKWGRLPGPRQTWGE